VTVRPASPAHTAAAGPAEWAKTGRPLPEPELLRPALDPALPPYVPGRRVGGILRGTATDVLPFLVERWIGAFRERQPDARIEVSPPYGGSPGAKRLIAGEADFSLQSRELKPDDLRALMDTFGYAPLVVPISGGSWRHRGFLDALTVIVHQDNPLERLGYAQLDRIFSMTRARGGEAITTWGQLGLDAAWAGRPISAWSPRPWNGYEEFFRQRVLSWDGTRGEWRDDLNFVDLVIPVAENVARDPAAIGITGMAFLADGVRSLAIAEAAEGPYIAPSQEEVARGRYPLSRVFYLVANKRPARELDPLLGELIAFLLSREGQAEVLAHGIFMPLRADALSRSRALVNAA